MSDQQQVPIRVLIVDDHKVLRKGLKAFLQTYDDLELVGEAGTAEGGMALCSELRPDVVLMDLVMPGTDGTTAIQHIRSQHTETQVIALTSFPEENLVEEALQAGAISYLLKNIDAKELANAIRDAHQGRSTLAPEAMQALIHMHTRKETPGSDLTPRERDVLDAMVLGYSNREIAEQLKISHSTVKFHVSNVLSKLGAHSRTEAVSNAIHYHIVD